MEPWEVAVGLIFLLVAVMIIIRTRIQEDILSGAYRGAGKSATPGEPFGPRLKENTGRREDLVHRYAKKIAHLQFPENPDTGWRVTGFEHFRDASVAIFEPVEDVVGHLQYKMVLSFGAEGAEPEHLATYALEDGKFLLMDVARKARSMELPETL